MENKIFSIKSRQKSFKYALNGLRILVKYEHNSRIHLVAMIFAITLGFILKISPLEWVAIVLVTGLVLSSEIINSSIEYLADFASPNYHEIIKKVKDLSAAAVLISALVAMIVAFIIFIPKIVELWSNY
ncbi:MAG: diacylglycerol kinase family protein [Bacteroidota bacterium]